MPRDRKASSVIVGMGVGGCILVSGLQSPRSQGWVIEKLLSPHRFMISYPIKVGLILQPK